MTSLYINRNKNLISFSNGIDDILKQLNETVVLDIAEDFTDYSLIIERFRQWEASEPATYENAFISLSLPKLFSPLIRYELVDWNPLDSAEAAANYLETPTWSTSSSDTTRITWGRRREPSEGSRWSASYPLCCREDHSRQAHLSSWSGIRSFLEPTDEQILPHLCSN